MESKNFAGSAIRIFRFFAVVLLTAVLTAAAAYAGEPFVWSAAEKGDQAEIVLDVAPGCYVYLDTLTLTVCNGDGSQLFPVSAPAATEHNDPDAGAVRIFAAGRHRWIFTGKPPFTAQVTFNGCRAAAGETPAVCFAPETLALLPLETPAAAVDRLLRRESAAGTDDAVAAASAGRPYRVAMGYMPPEDFLRFLESSTASSAVVSGGESSSLPVTFWGIFFFALLGGFALNLTPCVLPMIPINLAIIGASGNGRRTGFIRGAAYGGGMALAYGVLGLAVILTGARFGELNSSPVFNFAVAGVFLILSAAMAGFFNLRFDSVSGVLHPERWPVSGTLIAGAMGILAALLAGACVAPAVIAVLLLAAARYSAGEKAALFLPFVLGIGMALPWPLAGAGLSLLPRPGKFMVRIKYLLAAVIALAGVWYLVLGTQLLTAEKNPETEVEKLLAALEESQEKKQFLLVDFWAGWCKNCTVMEKTTLQDPAVKKRLQQMVFCRFQAEDPSDPAISGVLERWGISGLPAFVLISPLPAAEKK